MGNNPSYFPSGGKYPVESVSWEDAQEFCQKLSTLTKKTYRLPSEAEWEYACRAGTQSSYYFGDDENQLGEYAWYGENSNDQTQPVGQKKPNKWGLYDMLGNVWEWCEDDGHSNYNGAPTDGRAWIDNDNRSQAPYRIKRGGSWFNYSRRCRCAYRDDLYPAGRLNNVGFRVVLVVSVIKDA
jgi:formylglycine-generating enzyme required for sulfatase activity